MSNTRNECNFYQASEISNFTKRILTQIIKLFYFFNEIKDSQTVFTIFFCNIFFGLKFCLEFKNDLNWFCYCNLF